MGELKTKPTTASAAEFLARVENEGRRADCIELLELFKEVTGEEPRMWGASIVGYGSYHYKYVSGQEGEWPLTGFSPRKQDLTLYIMAGFEGYDDLMGRLGKHKKGKSCLYLKRLADVNLGVLRELIGASVAATRARWA